ncbi:MAG TPA: hypothetical protein VES65_11775 [Solirubrobacteraceae bacterium]|nr:hypothetical protein [Solirubrobacteraceae bacterium]
MSDWGVGEAGEIERVQEIDAIPVLASEPVVRGVFASEPRGRALIRSAAPAAQAAAVAAGGFVAGAAVVGLASRRLGKSSRASTGGRRRRRPHRRGGRRGRRAGELVQIVGTRSLLIDVHLLGGAGGDR